MIAIANHDYHDYPPEYQLTGTDDWPDPGKRQNQELSSLRFDMAAFQATVKSVICVTLFIFSITYMDA